MATVCIPASFWNLVGELAHVGWGALIVLACAAIFGKWITWYVAILFMIYAAIKEFWYDQNYETPDERGSNLVDFLFYGVGVIIGIILVYFSLIPGSMAL